ncbi:cytochrome c biogenesis CcdA family protein [Bradyrhizobium sp. 191]|uniref:cytochrome c biogenesis CcdA family protein n=1 Tax=Bradyrhizobium sp. 191 TaxID=2782659 RepID=UPI00077E318F|nr:cytochrome c biogenesis CcdA family protein [Bradyrhizobium sp. 191]KYK43498.1 cytochrome C biogenesis protein [Bradyrhizobium liaoningense]UPJ65641.1 cytochrome c biogenesis protein CcdA [Bradyrhizobium sp. 191]
MSATLALGYAAGALSTLSPCVLPILPIVLFAAIERHAWGPIALAAGLALSFAAVGIALATVGFSAGIDPAALRLAIAALLAAMGLVLLVPALQGRLAAFAAPLAAGGQTILDRMTPQGLAGQFIIGALLGVIWSPCTGPTLGAAVGLASQGRNLGSAAATMTAFALGAATPILLLAYGSRQAILARRDGMMRVAHVAKPAMGAVLVLTGLFILTGFDKTVEASLTRAMPDWLVAVTTRL